VFGSVPGAHFVQEQAPPEEILSKGHCAQVPNAVENVPAGHGVQAVDVVSGSVPQAHDKQEVDPAPLVY